MREGGREREVREGGREREGREMTKAQCMNAMASWEI